MNIKEIFNFSKQKPIIKLNGYKYIGVHEIQEGINYYIHRTYEYNS